jgi:hypothetical protein
MAASHGRALMDLMESAEVCFGFKVTLRLGCFASRVKDSSRIFASSASFASFQNFLHVAWFRSAFAQNPFRGLSFLLIECLSITSFRYAYCCPSLPIAAHYCLRLQFCLCSTSHCMFLVFRHQCSLSAFPSASPLGDACLCLLLLEPEFRIQHVHIDAIVQKAGNCQHYGVAGQLQRSYCLRHTCISVGLSRWFRPSCPFPWHLCRIY